MWLSELRAVVDALQSQGGDRVVTWAELEAAVPLCRIAEGFDVVAEMMRIEPGAGRGALVGFRELRRGFPLQGPSAKCYFDRVVMRAVVAGRVSAHRHDRPSGLSQLQRDELVFDGVDTYYVGCALR